MPDDRQQISIALPRLALSRQDAQRGRELPQKGNNVFPFLKAT
jgi:hypothetical protein